MKRIIGGAAAAGVAIFGGVTSFGDETTRNDAGEITESGGLGAFSIQLGDCMQLPGLDTLVQSVEGVPCTEPHDAQAFALFDMESGSFPGDLAVEAAADNGCYERFEGFVGTAYEESTLYMSALFPTAESWAQGDHEIVCLVVPATGQIDFDAQNSGV